MKNSQKKIILLIIVSLALPISQCTLIEEDIDGELSTTIPVNETQQGTNIDYEDSQILSADSDKDISDNLDKIKSWDVQKISYSIMGFKDDPSITFSGSVGFSRRNENSPSITASVSNLEFAKITDNGKKYKISLSDTDLAKIASIFDSDQAIKVYWKGVLSQGPMSCSVKVYAKVKVRAKLF